MSVAVHGIVASRNRNAIPFTSERALAIHNPMRCQMDPWLKGINFDPRALCDKSIVCVRLITLHTTCTKDLTAVQRVSTVT